MTRGFPYKCYMVEDTLLHFAVITFHGRVITFCVNGITFCVLVFITSCVKVIIFRVVITSCVNGITSRGDYYILRQYYNLRRNTRAWDICFFLENTLLFFPSFPCYRGELGHLSPRHIYTVTLLCVPVLPVVGLFPMHHLSSSSVSLMSSFKQS